MRQLVRLTLILCGFCAALVGTGILLGRMRPLPDRVTMLRLTDCAPPCWLGIVPGQTTLGEARERIASTFSTDPFVAAEIEALRRTLLVRLRSRYTADVAVDVRLVTELGIVGGNPDPTDPARPVVMISFAPQGKSSFVTAADLIGLWDKPSSLVQRSMWISGGKSTYFTELRFGRRETPGMSVNLTVPTRLDLDTQPDEIVLYYYLGTEEGRVHTWPGFIDLDRVQGNPFDWH